MWFGCWLKHRNSQKQCSTSIQTTFSQCDDSARSQHSKLVPWCLQGSHQPALRIVLLLSSSELATSNCMADTTPSGMIWGMVCEVSNFLGTWNFKLGSAATPLSLETIINFRNYNTTVKMVEKCLCVKEITGSMLKGLEQIDIQHGLMLNNDRSWSSFLPASLALLRPVSGTIPFALTIQRMGFETEYDILLQSRLVGCFWWYHECPNPHVWLSN